MWTEKSFGSILSLFLIPISWTLINFFNISFDICLFFLYNSISFIFLLSSSERLSRSSVQHLIFWNFGKFDKILKGNFWIFSGIVKSTKFVNLIIYCSFISFVLSSIIIVVTLFGGNKFKYSALDFIFLIFLQLLKLVSCIWYTDCGINISDKFIQLEKASFSIICKVFGIYTFFNPFQSLKFFSSIYLVPSFI